MCFSHEWLTMKLSTVRETAEPINEENQHNDDAITHLPRSYHEKRKYMQQIEEFAPEEIKATKQTFLCYFGKV